MALFETEGLILKTYSLAEADKIVIFFTKEHGLIRGVAKGAKRLKSRFGGGLEPFTVINLSFFQKEERELVAISNIELIKSYFSKAGNPEFLQKFSYLFELLFEFAPPNDANERLYRMACVCLETVDENPKTLESIAVYFELWLLRLAGYLPNWNKCDGCFRDLQINESTSLQINFHLLCLNCQKSSRKWNITSSERQIFIFAQKLSPVDFVEWTTDKQDQLKEISAILKRIISNILGKEIVGERILTANMQSS
jgi:DNA repair protein RecO (recombination protein O)